jgi:hypothetical protein
LDRDCHGHRRSISTTSAQLRKVRININRPKTAPRRVGDDDHQEQAAGRDVEDHRRGVVEQIHRNAQVQPEKGRQ